MTNVPESWEEKIREEYEGIVSDEQIEKTISYWRDFIRSEREALLREITSKVSGKIKAKKCHKSFLDGYKSGCQNEHYDQAILDCLAEVHELLKKKI